MPTVTSQTATASGELDTPLSRRGVMFAAVWLFFLVEPLRVGWAQRDTLEGALGIVATFAFGATYLLCWQQLRPGSARPLDSPRAQIALVWFAVLVALALLMVITLGQIGTTASVYIAVTSVMLFRLPVAVILVLVNAVLLVVLGETLPGWDSGVGIAFAACAASLAVFGIQQMMLRNLALVSAQEENAELAVENERTRFARDLHDILGHSLTVITVKAELAQRLLDVDPERTRAELADLERLSRDALADVRRAVEGYRELTLPGELSRARAALAAAGIDARLPSASDDVPTELRELFAWVVREGVTNVLRHSQARTCTIELGLRRVEVRDDGLGIAGPETGSGLLGLTERASAVGATVSVRNLEPGFSLVVEASEVTRERS